MPGTKINVWPNSIRLIYTDPQFLPHRAIQMKTLELNPGDIFVFRGDLVHAGAAYDKENFRIHCFLDSDCVLRDPNKTFLIHKTNEKLKKLIQTPH